MFGTRSMKRGNIINALPYKKVQRGKDFGLELKINEQAFWNVIAHKITGTAKTPSNQS